MTLSLTYVTPRYNEVSSATKIPSLYLTFVITIHKDIGEIEEWVTIKEGRGSFNTPGWGSLGYNETSDGRELCLEVRLHDSILCTAVKSHLKVKVTYN